MDKVISYVVARDYGFAPNPFYNYCTLATCKPKIRQNAVTGNWIMGTGSEEYNLTRHLIFVMKVSEKISFNQYWNDSRFQSKKPYMNGSLKQMYGDNIYYHDNKLDQWFQADSHHSNEDGTTNFENLRRDTQTNFVLVANEFYYFGKDAVLIPNEFSDKVCKKGPGHKNLEPEQAELLLNWLSKNFNHGINADPLLFNNGFERYKG